VTGRKRKLRKSLTKRLSKSPLVNTQHSKSCHVELPTKKCNNEGDVNLNNFLCYAFIVVSQLIVYLQHFSFYYFNSSLQYRPKNRILIYKAFNLQVCSLLQVLISSNTPLKVKVPSYPMFHLVKKEGTIRHLSYLDETYFFPLSLRLM